MPAESQPENEGEQTVTENEQHVEAPEGNDNHQESGENETHTHQDPYDHYQVVHENDHAEHSEHECPDLSHIMHFDTAAYQAQSAYCKQQMIWKKVIEDRTPQKFFVGEEF